MSDYESFKVQSIEQLKAEVQLAGKDSVLASCREISALFLYKGVLFFITSLTQFWMLLRLLLFSSLPSCHFKSG